MTLASYPDTLGTPADWKALDLLDQYGRLDKLLAGAEERGVLDGLPNSAEATRRENMEVRGQVIAERLWLLGYLFAADKYDARQAFSGGHRNTRFLPAVRAFQQDIGLKVDEWPGPITWKTLEQLVSFENDNLAPCWLESPEKFPALIRAAQSRLHILGLAQHGPGRDFKEISPTAVRKFHRLLFSLQALSPADMDDGFLTTGVLRKESLAILLDQDRLIGALSHSWTWVCPKHRQRRERFFSYKVEKGSDGRTKKGIECLLHDFVYRLALVEFWLLGYDVSLKAQPGVSFPVKGFVTRRRNLKEDGALKACLQDFARRNGKDERSWKDEISPELFIAMREAGELEASKDLNKDLVKLFSTQEKVEEGLQRGRQKGYLRLWDGIKRASRWLLKIFKMGVALAIEWANNAARLFYHQLLEAYDAVKHCVGVVVSSLQALNGSIVEAEGSFTCVLPDGDHTLCIDTGTDPSTLRALTLRLRLNSQRFYLAASLLALFLEALLKSQLARWAALALALFESGRACAQAMAEVYRLERELAAIG